MILTNAQICEIVIFDSAGKESIKVAHTVSEDVIIFRYGKHAMELCYGECRALAKALKVMMSEPDLADEFPPRLTRGEV